ncbi:hypothetical protein FA15DRAFT_710181 [Coprinopsis marcescibilis]|uniref:Uncharacterized protein n=1 Tax=Coprinopsis marcescibilis TaxID=230819 RepID=A0A5C3KE85_COPMA|nr:hypothetical protein FA15DRAFT_710181 [Coprinopsis marcescibilis]
MKENWKQKIISYKETNYRSADKSDFTHLFSHAYMVSFVPDTIIAAFRVTGVHPYSRDVISKDQMKPSLTTSTKGTFPLPQPSPVHAIMAALLKNPPTAFDTSPSTNPALTGTPRRSCTCFDADNDFTPSKRMRTMYSSLSLTSSGSFLVSKDKLTSTMLVAPPVLENIPPLPQPNWTLAKKSPVDTTVDNLQCENKILHTHLKQASIINSAVGLCQAASTKQAETI